MWSQSLLLYVCLNMSIHFFANDFGQEIQHGDVAGRRQIAANPATVLLGVHKVELGQGEVVAVAEDGDRAQWAIDAASDRLKVLICTRSHYRKFSWLILPPYWTKW